MVNRRFFRVLLPEAVRRVPADLVAALVVTAVANVVVFVPFVRETPLRIPVGLVFALFVPGYVFVAALFPEADRSSTGDGEVIDTSGVFSIGSSRSRIDWVERLALAFGSSVALIPLIGLALNLAAGTVGLTPIMVALTGLTLVATAIATVRRWELPSDERFSVPYREWYRSGRRELFEPETRFDGALNVLLALSLLLAVSSVAFAITSPPQGEQFSTIYLLSENEDGEVVAAGYPTEFVEGESEELVIGIENHERETTDYTVVALERETETEDNETIVTDQQELDRFEVELDSAESTHHTFDLAPTMTGEDVQIVWLLYEDDVPDNPSTENTDYYVHLWIDVDERED